MKSSVLLIYTGGTIGMVSDKKGEDLQVVDFSNILYHLPDLKRFKCKVETLVMSPPIDSSNMNIEKWQELVNIIYKNFSAFDGFVILHGTDTMAYTASALSFMFNNLTKPIIFTGSQLPINILRTDGKKNIITAIEIAAKKEKEKAVVPEVCILFGSFLLRGNRTTKHNAGDFKAFQSYNYPPLAEIGVEIKYNYHHIRKPNYDLQTTIYNDLDDRVAILKIFPGISKDTVTSFFQNKKLKGGIVETFGTGNAPNIPWLLNIFKEATANTLVLVNVTQCQFGLVNMQKYTTGVNLLKAGIIGGKDITTEAAITKLMYLLCKYEDKEYIKILFQKSIRGEMS